MNGLQSQSLAKADELAYRAQFFGLYKAKKIRHNAARSLGGLAHCLQEAPRSSGFLPQGFFRGLMRTRVEKIKSEAIKRSYLPGKSALVSIAFARSNHFVNGKCALTGGSFP